MFWYTCLSRSEVASEKPMFEYTGLMTIVISPCAPMHFVAVAWDGIASNCISY